VRNSVLLVALLAGGAVGCHHRPAVSGRDEVHGALGASLDRYLSALAGFGFSGSALVAKDGEVLLNKGYGWADRAHHKPYTAGTIFDIASLSKQFTAAAVLKLESEGRLRVSDPITKFFGPLPGHKAKITLHMLLTHTAGLPEIVGEEYEPVSRDEEVKRILGSHLLSEPGTKFHYSNAGYSLLAAVIEIVSREPYEKYLREKLFVPAGLRDTGFHVSHRAAVAHGYTPAGDWGTPLDHPWAADGPYWNLRGNGGILSTTTDLYRWHLALEDGNVLPKAESDKAVTAFYPAGRGSEDSYGYGWYMSKSPAGGRLASHVGGNLVFDSDVLRYLDDDVVIITSSNRSDYSGIAVAHHLESRVFGLPDPEPPRAATIAPSALSRCAGLYELPSGGRLQVKAANDHLEVAAEGADAWSALLTVIDGADRKAVDVRAQRGVALLEALRTGNVKPFSRLTGLSPTMADAEARATLAPWEARLGAWQGTEILGNASHGGHPYTYATLIFERGSGTAELQWAGMGLDAFRLMNAPPPVLFVPQKDGSFAGYDVRTGGMVRLFFEEQALVLRTDGEVRASARRLLHQI
jgi:CubicO group peptidase (beta-lactamase class C family)